MSFWIKSGFTCFFVEGSIEYLDEKGFKTLCPDLRKIQGNISLQNYSFLNNERRKTRVLIGLEELLSFACLLVCLLLFFFSFFYFVLSYSLSSPPRIVILTVGYNGLCNFIEVNKLCVVVVVVVVLLLDRFNATSLNFLVCAQVTLSLFSNLYLAVNMMILVSQLTRPKTNRIVLVYSRSGNGCQKLL